MRRAATPFFLLFGIILFVLAGFKFGDLIVNMITPNGAMMQGQKSAGSFGRIQENHPKRRIIEERMKQRLPQPLTAEMPVAPHNITEGPFDAKVRLTIFTDPACPACQRQVEDVVSSVAGRPIQIVYKFMPSDAADFHGGSQMGGIFQQLAQIYQLWPEVHTRLQRFRQPPTDTDWIGIFEDLGKPLTEVRHDLSKYEQIIMRNLELDRALAERALVNEVPSFFVNAFFIDGKMLTLGTLNRTISRLEAGQPVLRASEL